MLIQTNSLKFAKMLREEGFPSEQSEGFVATFSQVEVYNIYSVDEVDDMLSESVRQVFVEQDKKLAEQRREFDEKMKFYQGFLSGRYEISQHALITLYQTRL